MRMCVSKESISYRLYLKTLTEHHRILLSLASFGFTWEKQLIDCEYFATHMKSEKKKQILKYLELSRTMDLQRLNTLLSKCLSQTDSQLKVNCERKHTKKMLNRDISQTTSAKFSNLFIRHVYSCKSFKMFIRHSNYCW